MNILLPAFTASEKVDGLEFAVSRLENVPLEKTIAKRYDAYEIYFENQSDKTFSIPGYSLDLGVKYSTISDIKSLFKDKSSKKLAVFNIAASAASIAFGGIAKTAGSAVRSVSLVKLNSSRLQDDNSYLSNNKTYLLYPGDGISMYFFIDKLLEQKPKVIRFICKDEDSNLTHIVINKNLSIRELDLNNIDSATLEKENNQNVIAVP